MTISIESRRRSAATIAAAHPGAVVLDLTSKGQPPWVWFSPFYPHGEIPVPFTPGETSQSVEGIWQALKVFETADVDPAKLTNATMRGLKRTVRANGKVLGHRRGLSGPELLPYVEARHEIYLPAYRWMLEHRAAELVTQLRDLAHRQDIVLLDYTTNADPDDESQPLSHAALVACYLEGRWP